ncbi:alpha/beta fold hydrolase [Oscillatoria sp. CS-180]|uniref:YheT family hydrolase n=1 Tax=Oscillatoria sp. CS-180 TaxID=3021720 RepID=UPI00232BB8CB|nr:alpha/beta fold hydrolase [Oscillatoria sp. CS-180]MDB9525138.1 alpha/beta fold hydrolase [Oscillatoria sp. CS-180]
MPSFLPPWYLKSGFAMTLYVAKIASQSWQGSTPAPEPNYQGHVFSGADHVPIYGIVAVPPRPKGSIVGTYGITGELDNQWFLKILGRKAFAQGYAVVLFDWRAHGRTAVLSPTLTSDGLYEGEDFVQIAAQAKELGCPAPFWFTGYSLGGQLALWGIKTSQAIESAQISSEEIRGGAVICPSLDSERSLRYLVSHPLGKYIEKAIAQQLNQLAWKLHQDHPGAFDPAAIERADSIWGFDHELVISRLGFESVEDYYTASSPLPLLPHLTKSTQILYAADDPLFDPTLVPDLQKACAQNSAIDLVLTEHGGHVGYISSQEGQEIAGDPDPWWAWNRVLDWINERS